MTFSPTLIWFLAGLVLILVEIFAPGIILLFFGLGAWIVALTSYLGLTTTLSSQLLIFAISSLALLFLLRRWVRRRFSGFLSGEQDPDVNLDEFAGQRVLVKHRIEPGGTDGRVEFKGAEWKAEARESLAKGQIVEITRVEGITLIVRSIQGEE